MLGEFVSQLSVFATDTISKLGYPGLVAVMVLENVFPPIPSEAVLPFAGYLTTQGRFDLFWVVFSGGLGSVLGAEILYAIGFYGNELVVRRFIRRFGKWALITEDDLTKAERWFGHFGPKAVFTARLVPIVRSLVSIPAGLAKMRQGPFLFYTVLGTSLWSFILAYTGRVLGQNWSQITEYVGRYEKLTWLALFSLGLIILFRKYRNRRPSKPSLSSAE